MRNLKRALSLTLASVMLLGMMVVGSSAAAGYDDVADTDNVEAIEVLQAIDVMVGDERGFGPERSVNRAEMAVVMAKLLSLDYDYYATSCPFNDVYDWARPYVGAAAANGIVSGRGEGIYDPGTTVTAVEAASMLMRALGYFKYSNDYADGFEVSTVRQGTIIGIFDNVGSSATEPMTRNQIAQMVLNALRSAVVEPDGNTINLTTPDGTVYTGKVNYVSVTSAKPFARAISTTTATSVGSQNDGWIVELGERLYDGELKLTDHTIDAFGRPSRYWEYKGNAIGTYAKKELLVESFNVAVTGRQAYDLLGTTAINEKDLLVFVDGAENSTLPTASRIERADLRRANTNDLNSTGRGAVTEFYVDNSYDEITIAVINNYLAEAQNDYNATSEDIRMDIYYNVVNNNPNGTADPAAVTYPVTIEVEDYAMIESLKAEDYVRVTMAAPDHTYNAQYTDYSVESMNEMDVVADVTLSDYSAGDKLYVDTPFRRLSNVTTDGTRYNTAVKAFHDEDLFFQYSSDVESQLRDATYNLYLDQFGNILGIEQVEKADNYIFVVGYDQGSSVLAQAIDQALIIHTDGTMETVRIDDSKLKVWDRTGGVGGTTGAWVDANEKKLVSTDTGRDDGKDPSVNAWFTYSVKADGTYVLEKMVDRQGVQNRGTGEVNYIDNMHGSVTTVFTNTGVAVNSGDNYLFTGHDMPIIPNGIAYGNDDSVYITVDADRSVDNGGSIVKVNSVTTGLRNVSVRPDDVSTFTGIDYNTFFIYNSRGFVTYAVVIGTNGAAGYEYIYLDSAIVRTTNDNNDRYLYTFEGIRNNELTTFQSEVPQAYTATASAGVLTKSASATVTRKRGDIIRAAVDKDGIITEMVILPETDVREMNPERNADYGYTFKVDYNTVDYNTTTAGQDNNPKNVDNQNIRALRTNGNTLWVVTEQTEDNYTLLEPDVVFFVRNPSGASQHFTMYNNGTSAVNAVNATVNDRRGYISQVATVNDAVTGYAKTVVVDVVYTDSAVVNPNTPAGAPADQIGANNVVINLIDVSNTNTTDALIQNRVRALLNANGYTLTEMQQWMFMSNVGISGVGAGVNQSGGSFSATNRNGVVEFFNVTYNNWLTFTIDGIVREYFGYNTAPTMTNANFLTNAGGDAKKGTGYLWAAGYGLDDDDFTSYYDYPGTSGNFSSTNRTSPIAAKTGYVETADGTATANGGNAASFATINALRNAANTGTAPAHAAVGTTLTLALDINAGAYTQGVDVVVSGALTGKATWSVSDLNAGGTKYITVTVADRSANGTYTVTITTRANEAPSAALPSNPGTLATMNQPTDTTDPNYQSDMTAWKAQVVAGMKAKNPGVYSFTEELKNATNWTGSTMGFDVGSGVGRLAFVFRATGSATYYLAVKDSEGNTVVVCTESFSDSAKHYYYFDQRYIDTGVSSQYAPTLCTTGKAVGNEGLTPGAVYTWYVVKGTCADNAALEAAIAAGTNVVESGSFRAETGLASKAEKD